MKPLAWLLAASLLQAPLTASADTPLSGSVEIDVAKAKVLDTFTKISRISVTDPQIADVTVFSRSGLLVMGKKQGSTSVIVWTASGQRFEYDVTVRIDTGVIQRALRRAVGSEDLRAEMANERLVVSGRVAHPSQIELAGRVAEAYATHVVNLVQANPVPQVEVSVKIAELVLSNGHDAGVSWGSMRETKAGELTFFKDMMTFGETAGPPFGAQNLQSFGQFDRLAAQLKLLATEGKARILAEPRLVVSNGATASVLVGGEFPVPTVQSLGQVTVFWRGYGVKLEVGAQVNPDGRIVLRARPEVSALDFQNSIKIAGFTLPSLRSRSAETQVVLSPGEVLGIGGLTQTVENEQIERMPILGDIPVLGYLFSTSRRQREETELTIFVSPRLVVPESKAKANGGEPPIKRAPAQAQASASAAAADAEAAAKGSETR